MGDNEGQVDPDELLRVIRGYVVDIQRGHPNTPGTPRNKQGYIAVEFTLAEKAQLGEDLANAIDELDQCLTSGGFYPRSWV